MAGSLEVMRNCYLLIQETDKSHVCKNFLCFLFTDSMFHFLVNIYIFQALNSICIQFIIVVLTFVLNFSFAFVGFQASTLILKAQVSNSNFV